MAIMIYQKGTKYRILILDINESSLWMPTWKTTCGKQIYGHSLAIPQYLDGETWKPIEFMGQAECNFADAKRRIAAHAWKLRSLYLVP